MNFQTDSTRIPDGVQTDPPGAGPRASGRVGSGRVGSDPTVDPSPSSPHCQTPTSSLTRLQHLDLWLESRPANNALARAIDRRRYNDRLIVEAVDG